jgi:hypothetical protein
MGKVVDCSTAIVAEMSIIAAYAMIRELFFPQAGCSLKKCVKSRRAKYEFLCLRRPSTCKTPPKGQSSPEKGKQNSDNRYTSQESYWLTSTCSCRCSCNMSASCQPQSQLDRTSHQATYKLRHFGFMQSLYEKLDFPLILSQAVIAH